MRRGARAWRWGLLTGAVCLSAMTLDLRAQDTTVLAVVVPAGAEPEALEIAEVAQIFRRKKTLWSSGARIVPVNLPADHPLRLRFSRAVLRQSPQAMEDYWNQQYFQGVLPRVDLVKIDWRVVKNHAMFFTPLASILASRICAAGEPGNFFSFSRSVKK